MHPKLLSYHRYSNVIISIKMFNITGFFPIQKVLLADLPHRMCFPQVKIYSPISV